MTITQSFYESLHGVFESFRYEYEFRLTLRNIWGPEQEVAEAAASFSLSIDDVRFCLAEPEPLSWSIAFTPTFRKSISSVDRALQGRILSALAELSQNPDMPHGDTKKPLSGQLKGLWRYRLGNYRLLYEPRKEKKTVILLDFSARSEIYEA